MNTNKHVGPVKRIVSVYADNAEHELFSARAKWLGVSVGQYFRILARNDVAHGGGFVLNPGLQQTDREDFYVAA